MPDDEIVFDLDNPFRVRQVWPAPTGQTAPRLINTPQVRESVKPQKPEQVKSGSIIKSARKFGVELEVNLGGSGQRALRDTLSHAFNMVHDGSVNRGIEVVSSPLSGAAGEAEIKMACDALQRVKAGADDSCGMHVHVDAPDFYQRKRFIIITLSQALDELNSKRKSEPQSEYTILHASVIKDLKAYPDLYQELMYNHKLDAFSYPLWHEYARKCAAYSVLVVGDKAIKDSRVRIVTATGSRGARIPLNEKVKTETDIGKYKGEACLVISQYKQFVLIDPETEANTWVLKFPLADLSTMNGSIERLKRVAAFYVAFDDVIASMLPCDRRDNDFTKRVNTRLSIADIARIDNHTEFFTAISKSESYRALRDLMGQQRPEPRYSGVNFFALLKHGTIEIRYHAGTTQAEKVLRWTALHQAIVDGAADLNNRVFDLQRLEKAAMIIDLEAKTNLFFRKLRLDKSTEEYLRERIASFSKEDSVFVESLMADDGTLN